MSQDQVNIKQILQTGDNPSLTFEIVGNSLKVFANIPKSTNPTSVALFMGQLLEGAYNEMINYQIIEGGNMCGTKNIAETIVDMINENRKSNKICISPLEVLKNRE